MSPDPNESPIPPPPSPPVSLQPRLADTSVRPGRTAGRLPPRARAEEDDDDDQRFHLRFVPEEVIAVGGMGELRRHHDRFLRRDVVAKVVRPDRREDTPARLRLLREARIQANLQHPCIVPVYDIGNLARKDVFFMMAHIGGVTLQEILAGLREGSAGSARRFSRRRLLDAFCRVCLAIAYAHERGVVHRDLKPENVMLGEYGEVYVLDWGIAKQRGEPGDGGRASGPPPSLADLPRLHGDEDDDEVLTDVGATLGTLEYMAPEQFIGSSSPDERSDIYALGAMLYEILSLSWFRDAPSRAELARIVRQETFKPLDRPAVQGVSAELDAIWRKATATRPAKRFQTARQLHDAIIGHLDGEREKQRVRDVAMDHARAAALEIADDGGPPEEAEARRARALRRLGQALAVDPSLGAALQALVEDLVAHPSDASAEVKEQVLRTERETAVRSFGLSVIVFACWLLFLVIGHVFLTMLDRRAMLAMGAVVLALLGYNLWLWYTKRYERGHMLALLVLGFTAVGLASAFLGPLVLVPSLATTMFAAFATTMRSDERARAVTMVLSVASVLVPALLQLTGVVPPSYLFEDGKIIIVPRLVGFPSHLTPALLTAIALFTIVLGNQHFTQVVRALSRSERSALTQVHRLRQLLPGHTAQLPEPKH